MKARVVVSFLVFSIASICAVSPGCSSAPSGGRETTPRAVSSVGRPSQPESPSGLNYLNDHSISIPGPLRPPPATGSEEDLAELSRMEELQDSRTARDCERANSEVGAKLGDFFGPPRGPLTQAEVTGWTPFFEKMAGDTAYFVGKEKHHWLRPRPYQEDPELKPCVPLDPGSAYPSGHSTRARVFADVLDTLLPERKHSIDRRAARVARDRVLGGVHHPSDIAAGQVLGDAIFNALMVNPAFLRDLRDAAVGR